VGRASQKDQDLIEQSLTLIEQSSLPHLCSCSMLGVLLLTCGMAKAGGYDLLKLFFCSSTQSELSVWFEAKAAAHVAVDLQCWHCKALIE